MRILGFFLLAFGFLAAAAAYSIYVTVDPTTLTDDARIAVQMGFNAVAMLALCLPALAMVAFNDDARLRRLYPPPLPQKSPVIRKNRRSHGSAFSLPLIPG